MIMKIKLVKSITSYLLFACALVSLVVAMAPGTSPTARAAADGQACSVHMLRGLYLWTFDGSENFGGNFVPKAIMQGLQFNGDGTTFNPFGTVNIGGTIIIDGHRRGRNLYGEPGLHGHAVNHQRPNFQYICRAGCTEGLDSRDFSQSCRPRSERRNGDTAARAVKAHRLSWQNSTSGRL